MKLSPKAKAALAAKLRAEGIAYPNWTIDAAATAHLELAVACALLEQETGGGANVFGHDRDRGVYIFPARDGVVHVTEELYREYRRRRGARGAGGMQGVGPMQLTWWSIQDEADRRGGCWKPLANMTVGFEHAAALIRRNGLHIGLAAYNGTGPAADRYAAEVQSRIRAWEGVLALPAGPGVVVKQPKPKSKVAAKLSPRDWWKAFVFGDTDCERELLTALANVAKDYGQGARVFVRCGTRTFAEQAALYRIYLRDGHPLTARPGTSNHEARAGSKVGKAADCQLQFRNGSQVNIGSDDRARQLLRKRGLCLPVPGETWHVERGTTWRA